MKQKKTHKKDKFIITIISDGDKVAYEARGNMTAGSVKKMVGELEVIKLRLLQDF